MNDFDYYKNLVCAIIENAFDDYMFDEKKTNVSCEYELKRLRNYKIEAENFFDDGGALEIFCNLPGMSLNASNIRGGVVKARDNRNKIEID